MLSHFNILKYCNRPFENIIDMNKTIYDNALSRLKKGDIFYFLGDLSFDKREVENFFSTMFFYGVQIHFIFGNHDYPAKKIIENRSSWSGDLKSISIQEHTIVLSHYNMRVWPKSHFNSWHLFGHSHGGLSNINLGKAWDVGVDNNNFQILSLDEIVNIMENQPDNFNKVNRGLS